MEKDPLLHRRQTGQRDAAGLLARGLRTMAQANGCQFWQAHCGDVRVRRNTPTLRCDIRFVRCSNKARQLE